MKTNLLNWNEQQTKLVIDFIYQQYVALQASSGNHQTEKLAVLLEDLMDVLYVPSTPADPTDCLDILKRHRKDLDHVIDILRTEIDKSCPTWPC